MKRKSRLEKLEAFVLEASFSAPFHKMTDRELKLIRKEFKELPLTMFAGFVLSARALLKGRPK